MQKLPLASAIGWGFPTWREAEEAELLAALGIRRVQVFRNREKPFAAPDVRRWLTDQGLACTSFHAAFGDDYDPSRPDDAARRRSVENLAREVDVCMALGGRLLVVHPGDAPIGPEMHDAERIGALERSAAELAALGEREGCTIALENLQPDQMGNDMAMLRRIVDAIDSPRLGLNYDCGHANLGQDPVAVLHQAGPRIASTHIHDNSGRGDDHFAPGFGSIDIDAVCRALAEIGYRGEFVLELMETTDALRRRCDAAWMEKLGRWLDLASGIAP